MTASPSSGSLDAAKNSAESDGNSRELRTFAASLVHELRTPLSALTGEVELALRRERTPAAYREALSCIARQAAELADLIEDLALVGDPERLRALSTASTDLRELTTQLSARYDPSQAVIAIAPENIRVAGDQALLARAFRLLLDHALRPHGHRLPVRLRVAPDGSDAAALLLEAASGFSRRTWHHLNARRVDTGWEGGTGLLRLQTASRIAESTGATVTVEGDDGLVCVRINLRRVS